MKIRLSKSTRNDITRLFSCYSKEEQLAIIDIITAAECIKQAIDTMTDITEDDDDPFLVYNMNTLNTIKNRLHAVAEIINCGTAMQLTRENTDK